MSDLLKPNHYFNDSLGDPAVCADDHNHPEPAGGERAYTDEQKFYDENLTPDLPMARLEWRDLSASRKIGLVNGHVVYDVRCKRFEGPGTSEFQIFHRLPVASIDKTFKTSDEAKLYADTHLHRAMRVLGFVAR